MSKLMQNKLVQQILKFGVVGGISFLVDWVVGLIVMKAIVAIKGDDSFFVASMIAAVIGFTVSVVVNYILSFKFVFERKEDLDKKAEFSIFVILSLIGAGLNTLIIGICTGPIYNNFEIIQQMLGYEVIYTGAKVIATVIVMVYNFITRKIFLEKK